MAGSAAHSPVMPAGNVADLTCCCVASEISAWRSARQRLTGGVRPIRLTGAVRSATDVRLCAARRRSQPTSSSRSTGPASIKSPAAMSSSPVPALCHLAEVINQGLQDPPAHADGQESPPRSWGQRFCQNPHLSWVCSLVLRFARAGHLPPWTPRGGYEPAGAGSCLSTQVV
jgi:hypothetical protein